MKKSKKTLRILSLALTMIFALSLAIMPISADPGSAAELTITAESPHTFKGQTLDAYLLFTLKTDPDGSGGYSYDLNSAFSGFTSSLFAGISLEDFLYENAEDEGALVRLERELLNFIELNNILPTDTVDDEDSNVVTFAPPVHGLYFITGAVSLNDDDNDPYSFMSLMNTNYGTAAEIDPAFDFRGNLDVKVKMDFPTITKTSDKETEFIGGTVNYTLSAEVPNTAGFDSYIYKVTDTMSSGLTFNGDIAITVGDYTCTASDYTLDTTDINGFALTFNSTKFLTFQKGQPIIITYSADLNADAVIGAPGNNNSVTLEYSNDPNNSSDTTTTPPEETVVYTFEIDINKFSGDTLLSGVKFVLSKNMVLDVEEDIINVVNYSPATDSNGLNGSTRNIYRVATSDDLETDYVDIVTAEGGRAVIKGLDIGTYYLHEVTTPSGYSPLSEPITIVISGSLGEHGYIYSYDVAGENQGTNSKIDVENKRTTWLPGTGGVGTTILYVGGAVLIVGGIILLLVRSKKSGK
ncbi:MAG: isopeptide-forming domain-containing fimbrial protein [Oscillospiraceae bacterium]|nr:isopeptide-forming domain-containing fimbrial protein [Oscillospiraceae bacterium]